MKKKVENPLLNYENKWVALDEKQEKVVLFADTLAKLQKKIVKQKSRSLAVMWVSPFDVYLAPYVLKKN